MTSYAMFQEIINDIAARPDADPVGILEEYVGPLVDMCNDINQWLANNRGFDLHYQPPWYEQFIIELARYDVDLTSIWRAARADYEQQRLRAVRDGT